MIGNDECHTDMELNLARNSIMCIILHCRFTIFKYLVNYNFQLFIL